MAEKWGFDMCRYAIWHQCNLQMGDSEDITADEMKMECLYWDRCPYSKFSKKKEDA